MADEPSQTIDSTSLSFKESSVDLSVRHAIVIDAAIANSDSQGRDCNSMAPIPAYSREGDAGMDLRASCDVSLAPGSRAAVPCGFAMAIPAGFCGLVLPRSGLALKHGVTVLNTPGLIDSNYRGEVQVILYNSDKDTTFDVKTGDRIAQLVIIEAPHVDFHNVPELNSTNRGAQGFGSSGIQ
jgi:dUTP pyrophosphatase